MLTLSRFKFHASRHSDIHARCTTCADARASWAAAHVGPAGEAEARRTKARGRAAAEGAAAQREARRRARDTAVPRSELPRPRDVAGAAWRPRVPERGRAPCREGGVRRTSRKRRVARGGRRRARAWFSSSGQPVEAEAPSHRRSRGRLPRRPLLAAGRSHPSNRRGAGSGGALGGDASARHPAREADRRGRARRSSRKSVRAARGSAPVRQAAHRAAKVAVVRGERAKLYEMRQQVLDLGDAAVAFLTAARHRDPRHHPALVQKLFALLQDHGDQAVREAFEAAHAARNYQVSELLRALRTSSAARRRRLEEPRRREAPPRGRASAPSTTSRRRAAPRGDGR